MTIAKLALTAEARMWRTVVDLSSSLRLGIHCSVSESNHTPNVTRIHPGNNAFLKEAPTLIVKLFKEHPEPEKAKAP